MKAEEAWIQVFCALVSREGQTYQECIVLTDKVIVAWKARFLETK